MQRYSPGRMALGLLGLAVLATACGSGANRPPARVRASGTAEVAYAGSLQYVNEKVVGPAFAHSRGYRYQGRGGGSFGLAQEINSGEIQANVFMSVGQAPIAELEPRLTRWSVQFLSSPLVVAYNPKGAHAGELAAIAAHRRPLRDLFALLGRPGFRLGRTNPQTDPQGQAFVEMVELASHDLSLPAATARAVLGPLDNPAQVFAETALEARLEAGQLDAASAFLPQALQLHLPYVALPPDLSFGDPALAPAYAQASVDLAGGKVVHGVPLAIDVTTLGHTDAAADAFVAFVLSPAGQSLYRRAGYQVLSPTVDGPRSALPKAVADELG